MKEHVRYAVGSDKTVDALCDAWRNEALEEAAKLCERHILPQRTPDATELRQGLARAIRALKRIR